MKNTSLFVSFWAMPKRKPSVEPPEAHWVKRHACSRGYRGHGVVPPNRQLSLILERNIIDVATSENLRRQIFLVVTFIILCDHRKCEKEHNFDVWKAPPSQFKRQNYCPFSASPSAQHNKRNDMENLPTQNFLISQRLLCCAQKTNDNWRLGLSAL